jgi:hypothetical protein
VDTNHQHADDQEEVDLIVRGQYGPARTGAFCSVVKLMVQEIHQVISPVSPEAIIRPKSSTGWADLDLWTIEDQYHIWTLSLWFSEQASLHFNRHTLVF